ncbi:hypothetical protein [Streptomyces sp. Rer75]|uniref:hypothetical protein n=1 Tax=Streptomyces sp. Rer75 TaxID=2750011 RepID=UPI0015CFB60A|nr:hypothetical protein [Streptomyces sp. Rer75]QLH25922.1 hypothetical protein HYQ63_39395 [Streptomyces sp. Rer75]
MIETVVMHMDGAGQEYVVKTDPGTVARMRASLLRTMPWSAWGTAIISVLLGAAIAAMVFALDLGGTELWFLLFAWPVPVYLYDSKRQFTVIRRLKQTWAVKEISPVAMRVTDEGLWCAIDAAPEDVFLPWAAVTNVQVKVRGRISALLVALAPGATTAPGVSGLDQPEVRRRTRRNWKGVSRLRVPVFSPRQPVSESEIDQALGHFSGGRVRVR